VTLLDLDGLGVGPSEPESGGATTRVVLGIAYDGSSFRGVAQQPRLRTVLGVLDAALIERFNRSGSLVVAGRTDAGVHARGQVCHADLPTDALNRECNGELNEDPASLEGLRRSLVRRLAPEVSVFAAFVAPPQFHARHSALSRRYSYRLSTAVSSDPLRRHDTWFVGAPLDLAAMRQATDPLIGEHDFTAFCRRVRGAPREVIRRRVLSAEWHLEDGDALRFEIEANAFCHQMVRSIVGLLVEIGLGRRRAVELATSLDGKTRQGGARPAPPGGLVLELVRYPPELLAAPLSLPRDLVLCDRGR